MYIVTGGAGFIGSAMIWRLNQMGITNIVVVDNLADSEKWKNLVNRRYEDYVHRDTFIKMVRTGELPWPVKGIVHMGACSSTTQTDADFLMENNFHYTRDLCLFALSKGLRFINASSAATYGDGSHGFSDSLETMDMLAPLNMYGYSKLLFDRWAQRKGVLDKIVSLRFFNVYGPNEYHKGDMKSMICKAFKQIQESGTIRLFASDKPEYPDGGQMRDFVYVKDCVAVQAWLLDHPDVNGIFNVGSGKARTWNDLANAVFRALGKEPNICYVGMPSHLKGKYQYFTQADIGRLAKYGYPIEQFHSLEDGVRDYVRNYLTQSDQYL